MIDLSKVWEMRNQKESDINPHYKIKVNGLDRATYFEYKAAGVASDWIRRKHQITHHELQQLIKLWDMDGVTSKNAWHNLVQRAREQDNKTG